MKVIFLILLVIVALLLGHNYLQTGKIGFNVSLSPEERELRQLDERLDDALRGYRVAGRATAVGGLEPDSSAEDAAVAVRVIERDLASLKESISGGEHDAAIRELEQRLAEARAEMGLPEAGY